MTQKIRYGKILHVGQSTFRDASGELTQKVYRVHQRGFSLTALKWRYSENKDGYCWVSTENIEGTAPWIVKDFTGKVSTL